MSHSPHTHTYRQLVGSDDILPTDFRVGLRAAPTVLKSRTARKINLPCAKETFAVSRNKSLQIKDEDGSIGTTVAKRVTLVPVPGQTIDGGAALVIDYARAAVEIYTDGENWQVLHM